MRKWPKHRAAALALDEVAITDDPRKTRIVRSFRSYIDAVWQKSPDVDSLYEAWLEATQDFWRAAQAGKS